MVMDESSIQKTAFVTKYNQYEFVRLPFGLKNAGVTFQRLMNKVLQDLIGKCCFVYIDDIVVYSRDIQQHFQDLKKVFAALESAGLTFNLKKYKLVRKSLTFLGHVISEEGIKTEDSKVNAVRNFPTPKNVKEVERFLGLAGWYHRFIPYFSECAAPLHALKKKGIPWNWSEECQHSVEDLKYALQKAPALMPPDSSRPFKVQTDASDIGLGAAMTCSERGEHVIAYASRLLQGAENSYAVSEKECLAVVWAVEKWRQYLEGRPFVVLTDHAALTWVFNHPRPTSRLTRWAIRLQGFDFTVRYRKGRCNVVPDSLSRAMSEEEPLGCVAVCQVIDVNGDLPINWEELGQSQKSDQSLQPLWDEAKLNPIDPQRIHYVEQNNFLFRCIPDGQKGHTLQVIIPKYLRQQFLQFAHDNPLSGHLGRMKTLRRLLNVVYWPEIQQDVWGYCKRCQVCQQYKPRISKLSGTLQSTPVKEPGYMVGIDLMGPFPRSMKLNEYLLVTVNYCSKWVEVFPLRSAKTPLITNILIKEIFTRWGVPTYLVSDRGPQFTSQLLHATCRQWGAIQKLTTAYHPQTNLTERVNRTLKIMIASYNVHQGQSSELGPVDP